ncbi:hypothetical protein [Lysinibacillus sp. ZYM-1]|uniref:hypothetical protein n=1 Tax=Lysinibacillus sp. ZYM-1 TaxID=1681184 RepID=UPI0006CE9729|nr:hypothetical protein [Lysinibacillus sp. ZYM-1]KPN97498.1 hypothetical protein AO843_13520 [Lysinibacillus sp. ZYM-1]
MVSMEDMSIKLAILRGAYGYKGFTEQVGENMYKVDTKAFKETIENAKEPIDQSKVSKLSSDQIKVLQGAPSGSWLIPLLNRMGQLGMMDLREGLVNPKIFQYTSTMNAYNRSI